MHLALAFILTVHSSIALFILEFNYCNPQFPSFYVKLILNSHFTTYFGILYLRLFLSQIIWSTIWQMLLGNIESSSHAVFPKNQL